MQAFLECIPCITNHAIGIIKRFTSDPKRQITIFKNVLGKLQKIDTTKLSPPQITKIIHLLLQKEFKTKDLFLDIKKESNLRAQKMYPKLKKLIGFSNHPLNTAIRIAIAGNIIDYGLSDHFDIDKTLHRVLRKSFAINDIASFRSSTLKPKNILYITDNSGEIFFDKILIKYLTSKDHKIVVAVKSAPTLNDATYSDALEAGLDKLAYIIESGSTNPGTILTDTSPEFKKIYNMVDFVIAKGQGNYETLVDQNDDKRIYFLFKVKCRYIAKYLGVEYQDIIIKKVN